jgi:hypothetical protein
MTTTSGAAGVERYPGETLDLLRSVHSQLGELLTLREEFGPLLDSIREGRGLLGMARAARRSGGRDDYPASGAPGAVPPGPGQPGAQPPGTIGPGIFGRLTHRAPGS